MKKFLKFILYLAISIPFISNTLIQAQNIQTKNKILNIDNNLIGLVSSNYDKNNLINKKVKDMELYEILARGGYWLYFPARITGHSIERATRPFKYGEHGYKNTYSAEILERIKSCFIAIVAAPSAVIVFPFAEILLTISHLLKPNLVQVEEGKITNQNDDQICVLFFNSCMQGGPFSALTGGVASLHERFDENHLNRVSAIADFIENIEKGPDVVCISEGHSLAAIDEIKVLLKEKGYYIFINDIPTHPIFNNSGLIVASKKNISNIKFAAYPFEDRSNVHMGAKLGCIMFDLMDQSNQKIISIVTTHLNYGNREIDFESRRKQLRDYIFKNLPQNEPSLIGGDFNYEYLDKLEELKKLANDRNIISLLSENIETTRVTFEKDGNIRNRQKPKEVIDAALLVGEDDKYTWQAQVIEPKLNNKYVSDHYAVLVTATLKEKK